MSASSLTWKEDVAAYVKARWPAGDSFRLEAIYSGLRGFEARHPRNSHVKDKLRQTLQVLREEGLLEFVDGKGTYRVRR